MTRAQTDAVVAAYALLLEQLEENFGDLDSDQRLRVSLLAANFTNACRGKLAAIEQREREERARWDRLKGTAGE
jgi:hypothetical protein